MLCLMQIHVYHVFVYYIIAIELLEGILVDNTMIWQKQSTYHVARHSQDFTYYTLSLTYFPAWSLCVFSGIHILLHFMFNKMSKSRNQKRRKRECRLEISFAFTFCIIINIALWGWWCNFICRLLLGMLLMLWRCLGSRIFYMRWAYPHVFRIVFSHIYTWVCSVDTLVY